MLKVRFECQYCGNKWKVETWNSQTSDILTPRCSICKETKLLKVHKEEEGTSDIFGYRFSPPFPEKPKNDSYGNYVKYWD